MTYDNDPTDRVPWTVDDADALAADEYYERQAARFADRDDDTEPGPFGPDAT